MGNEPVLATDKSTKRVELTPEDVKDAHWFMTPLELKKIVYVFHVF